MPSLLKNAFVFVLATNLIKKVTELEKVLSVDMAQTSKINLMLPFAHGKFLSVGSKRKAVQRMQKRVDFRTHNISLENSTVL